MSNEPAALIVRCPNCKTSMEWSSKNVHRPFCSERCKLIDLGAWANEEHSIPGEPEQPWEASDNPPVDFDS